LSGRQRVRGSSPLSSICFGNKVFRWAVCRAVKRRNQVGIMQNPLRLTLLLLVMAALLPAVHPVQAYEPGAVLLQFNPKKDYYSRSMFQLALRGEQVTPGEKDQISLGEYLIGTVYKDTVTDSLMGLNRHHINFYEYQAQTANLLNLDRVDQRFGGSSQAD